jgi:uncharacterized membrane protein
MSRTISPQTNPQASPVSFPEEPAAPRALAWTLILGGLLGWIAAFMLTLERFHLAEHPQSVLSCDVNVFISCKSVMLTWQARLLGFPNALIGVTCFVIPILVGVAVLAGARFAPWFWRLFLTGVTGAFGFVCWLASQSLFVIHALCPYCMLAWVSTIAMFWPLLLWLLRDDILPGPVRFAAVFDTFFRRAWVFVTGTYLTFIATIIVVFWAAWSAMFH